jgi:hypothetical protein
MRRFLLLALALLPAVLHAQAPEPRIVAVRAETPPRIDGVLDDAVWAQAIPTADFRQRQPVDLGAPTERTELRVAYDERALYIGLKLFDREPHLIRAAILDRGGRIDKDDNVRIALDTFFDRKNAYIFEINPLGTQDDAILTDEGQPNWNWDGVYRSEAKITAEGWTLEVMIPFTTIRFSASEAPLMGIAVQRTINRKNEEVLFPGIRRDYRGGFFQVSQYARLEGLQGIRRAAGVEIKPYALAGAQRTPAPGAPGTFRNDFQQDVGVDARWTITSNLALDATINTDFAQVESDLAQINLTRFNLFFPEKRGFFLERAGLFAFGNEGELETFFSRRIGLTNPILGGARLTGQVGDVSLGLLNLQTRAASGQPGANYSVARVQTALGPRASVGGIVTNVEVADSSLYNRALGLDGTLRFWGSSSVDGWFTNVWSPDGRAQNRAGAVRTTLQRDVYSVSASYTNVGRDFDPGVGFVSRRDMVRYQAQVGYRPLVGDGRGRVRRIITELGGASFVGQDGRLQSSGIGTSATVQFRARDRISAYVGRSFERLDEPFRLRGGVVTVMPGRYPFTIVGVSASTDESRRAFARVGLNADGFFDGTQRGIFGGAGYRFSRHLKAEGTLRYSHIEHASGRLDAAVGSLRIEAAASRKLFARALVQYDNFSRLVRANVRVNWIHTPGSDLFVVFNTSRLFDADGDLGDLFRPGAYALVDQAAIVKLTYRIAL